MTESELRNLVLKYAKKFVGCQKGDQLHKELIDYYNENVRINGSLPRGYKVTYTDSYCATACSAWMAMAGLLDLIYPECGVQEMINGCITMDCWVEDDDYVPTVGDFITFTKQSPANTQNTGYATHIALVSGVEGDTIHTINPNSGGAVIESDFKVGADNIRGYITPNYKSKACKMATVTKCFKLLTSYDPKESVYCNIEIPSDGLGIRNWVDVGEKFEVVTEKDGFAILRVQGKYEWLPWYPVEFLDIQE